MASHDSIHETPSVASHCKTSPFHHLKIRPPSRDPLLSTALALIIGSGLPGSAVLSQSVAVTGDTIPAAATSPDWNAPIILIIGASSDGTLTAADGGTVSSASSMIGLTSGSAGVATITGPGSTWTNTGVLAIGFMGKGELTVRDGGATSNTNGSIANNAGSQGTVTVTGTGSTWTNSGDLTIGKAGRGTLNLGNGGTVRAGSAGDGVAHIARETGAIGSLVIGGGRLEAGEVRFGAGSGTITFNHGSTGYLFTPDITGQGSVSLISGTTILTGENSYTGNTQVGGGVLQIGDHGTNGSIAGNVLIAPTGRMRFARADDWTYSGAVSGFGNLDIAGAGATTLTGDSSAYNGTTTIANGALLVGHGGVGSLGGVVNVLAGGTLGGSGSVGRPGGTVTIADGGRIAPGNFIGTLSVAGNLMLNPGSILDYELGAPGSVPGGGASDHIAVAGHLTLDGTLNLSNAGGAGIGYYRLMSYGSLTDNGLSIGTTPAPGTINHEILTGGGHVDLLAGTPGDSELQSWQGGNGTWNSTNLNWLNHGGDIPASWAGHHGAFTGAGGLVDVEGNQSFKGLQFVTGGYALGGSGTLATLAAGSELRVLADVTATIGTQITGAGGIVKTQGGTLVLTGNNAYAGGTTIEGGTLSAAADAALGHGAGALTLNGGLLQVTGDSYQTTGRPVSIGVNGGGFDIASAGNVFTLSQAVTGAGDLYKAGAGTLALSGTGAYGDTFVTAGTLVGDAASISGHIGNAGTTVFDQAADATFSGNIHGLAGTDGEMIKRGTGTLTLTGASALDWSVQTGKLITEAGRFGGHAALASGASLTFHQSGHASYAGVLSGSGAFGLTGSGAVTLTGDSSAFAGTTTAGNGTALIVGTATGGTLGGSINIGSGGLLGGIGDLGSAGSTVTIAAGGVHAPGNGPGQQTVLGDYRLHGTLRIDATPAGTDTLSVRGNVDIAGSALDLQLSSGTAASWNVANGPFTIIDNQGTGAVNGTFATVNSNFMFLDPHLNYAGGDGNDVTLGLMRNDVSFASVAQTRNQIAMSGAIDTLPISNPVWNAIVLTTDENAARRSFDLLSGEIHATARGVLLDESRFIRNTINDRVRAAFDSAGASRMPVMAYASGGPQAAPATTNQLAVWGHAFGSWGKIAGDGNAAGLDRSTGGFFIGADTPLFDAWRLGAVAGYSHSTFQAGDRLSSGASDTYHVGLYGGTTWGALSFRTGAAYAWHDISTSRAVLLSGFGDNPGSRYNAATAQVFGELGHGIRAGNAAFEPFVNLAYVNLNARGFTENGGAAALTSPGGTTDTIFTTLGLRGSATFALAGANVTARAMAGWRHAFGDVMPLSTMQFAGGGNAFTIAGAPLARDAAVVEAGLDLAFSPNATVGISYGGQFGPAVTDQTFRASFNAAF